MKMLFLLPLLFSGFASASEWVTLKPEDLLQYEVLEPNAYSFAEEGLYVKHKTEFPFTASVTCSKKRFVAFTNEKLADRALSSLMFAIASGKTMRFHVDGCSNQYPLVKNFILLP